MGLVSEITEITARRLVFAVSPDNCTRGRLERDETEAKISLRRRPVFNAELRRWLPDSIFLNI